MTVYRVLLLVAMLVSVPFAGAAQRGGIPFVGSPPACGEILALRAETQKRAQAIQQTVLRANEGSAPTQELCRLFGNFLAVETKLVNGLEEHGGTCGAPPDVLKRLKEGHLRTSQIANRLCEAAARGPRHAGPSRPANPSSGDMWPAGDYWRPGEFERLKGPPNLQ